MQPNTLTINDANYQVYTDPNDVNFPAAPVPLYALRRIFNLVTGTPKTITFTDLPGFWLIDSCYISSPEDSEITFEILDSNNIPFYSDKLLKNQTPKSFPTVIITNTLKLKLTASRNDINLALVYLKPAYLAYSQDF